MKETSSKRRSSGGFLLRKLEKFAANWELTMMLFLYLSVSFPRKSNSTRSGGCRKDKFCSNDLSKFSKKRRYFEHGTWHAGNVKSNIQPFLNHLFRFRDEEKGDRWTTAQCPADALLKAIKWSAKRARTWNNKIRTTLTKISSKGVRWAWRKRSQTQLKLFGKLSFVSKESAKISLNQIHEKFKRL